MAHDSPTHTLRQIAELLECELSLRNADSNAASTTVTGLATLSGASESEISFLANARYKSDLKQTRALAVILHPDHASESPVHCLMHRQPYQCYASLTRLFESRPAAADGVNERANIDSSARLGSKCKIAAGAVIGRDVVIGDEVEIGPNVVIEANCRIGNHVYLAANVCINHSVKLGDNVRVQSGSVIGSEGFGYAPVIDSATKSVSWDRIAQLGSVVIGDNVEIGANTTIDRGALDNTVIEDNVIIDNQVQVAHNVHIGSGTAIAGCVGIAGSAKIGRGCSIGGGAGIAGHLSIADGTTVLGMTLINRSVKKPGVYASGTGMQPADQWRKSAVRFTQLDELNKRVKELEMKLAADKNC